MKRYFFTFLLLLGLGIGIANESTLHTQDNGGLPGHHSDTIEIG